MSDVFISYAREDHASAQTIADALGGLGLSVFWDRAIPTGRAFEDAIEQEIGKASAVVVLWSKHSVRSEWVRAEASEAANRGILVPASLDGERAPLRYRLAQTADLAHWKPGRPTESYTRFLHDVVRTARASAPRQPESAGATSDDGGHTREPVTRASEDRDPTLARMRALLKGGILFAWTGSMALAVTLAYDYGLVTQARDLHVVALALTFLSLTGGGITSAAFGGLSLRRNFVAGVLQGWLWPIVGAIGDLVLLMNFRNLIRELPFKTDPEILLAFVLCSAIAPTLLTVGAILTSRSLEGTGAGAAPEP